MLYPLRLSYSFHRKIWGGRHLANYVSLPKNELIGEVSLVSDGENGSVVLNGPYRNRSLRSICQEFGKAVLGSGCNVKDSTVFPLVLKYIHSQKPLSIQVHPDAAFAQKYENAQSGKTEAWLVLASDENATVKIGFRMDTNQQQIVEAVEKGNLENLLVTHRVSEGDTFYLPAGQVHSLGAGVVLAEIQQNTLITYRLYDFNRIDPATGYKRKLDIEKALQVLDYSQTSNPKTGKLVEKDGDNECLTYVVCRHFCGQIVTITSPFNAIGGGFSFHILTITNGSGKVLWRSDRADQEESFNKGDTLLIPADLGDYTIIPDVQPVKMLKYFVPDLTVLWHHFRNHGFSKAEIRSLNGYGKTNDFDSLIGL